MGMGEKEMEELAHLYELAGLKSLDAHVRELIRNDEQAAARALLAVFKPITEQIAEASFNEATAKIAKIKDRLEGMRMRMQKIFPLILPPQDGPLVDAQEILLGLLARRGAAAVPAIVEEIDNDRKHPGLLLLVGKLAEIGDPTALPTLEQLVREQQEAIAEMGDKLPVLVLFAKDGKKENLAEMEELTVFPALVPFAKKHYHEEVGEAVTKAIIEIGKKGGISQAQIDDRCCKESIVRQHAPGKQNIQPLARQQVPRTLHKG